MKWKSLKRGLAVVLSALLIMSSVSVYADDPELVPSTQAENNVSNENLENNESESTEETKSTEEETESTEETKPTEEETESTEETKSTEEETESTEETKSTEEETESTEENITETELEETTEELTTEIITEMETETKEIKAFADIEGVVTFNTGRMEINVIPFEDYSEEQFEACLADNIYIVPFNEDGSYTIEVENDAFFPYEVRFKYDDNMEDRWFLSPYDKTSVSGHTFCIHSEFSGDVITQMNLSVAGKNVTVYPEKKNFTNDGGISTYSLLPLTEKNLTVDLTGLNPLQLTRVSLSSVFAGESNIGANSIVWSHAFNNDRISSTGDVIDLSYATVNGGATWEMIVGADNADHKVDQLDSNNIRYKITIHTNKSENWLNPSVYKEQDSGTVLCTSTNKYDDTSPYYGHDIWRIPSTDYVWGWIRTVDIHLEDNTLGGTYYIKLDKTVFGNDTVKVYDGLLESPDEIGNTDIDSNILDNGVMVDLITEKHLGFGVYKTLVSCDNNNNVTGFLPLRINVWKNDVVIVDREETQDSEFQGIKLFDVNKNEVPSYVVPANEDSYAEYNYLTILVDENVDTEHLVLKFVNMKNGVKIFCEGNEENIKDGGEHDFSKNAIQYTIISEEGTANYWVQVIKPDTNKEKLYINSLAAADSNTRIENGITYTTREVMIDGIHDYIHDILLVNMGNTPISNISVKLDSASVELDSYWTLSGSQDLKNFDNREINNEKYLSNLAKIRLKPKNGIANSTQVEGRLIIKGNGKELIIMELKGIASEPTITTDENLSAVKYVPYSTMIQNDSKYSSNKISYILSSGRLPEGMKLEPNGELHGVPKEAGEFQITVKMKMKNFACDKKFKLEVKNNSDENVNETNDDENYKISESLRKVEASPDYIVVSNGNFSEFKNVYIDGEQLIDGVDYTAEEGSTKITIRSETISKKSTGKHTLGLEFRENGKETGELKRAAQNFIIKDGGIVEEPSDSSSNNNPNDRPNNNNSNESSSNDNSSDNNANSSMAVLPNPNDVPVDVAPMEGFAFKEGYPVLKVDVSRDKLLKAELLNKYFGQQMHLNVFFGANFGLTIDMTDVSTVLNDINIIYTLVQEPSITPDFNVIHAIPDMIKPLEFDAIFNFHLGYEYVGKKAYIYQLKEDGSGYDLVCTTIVNEIGNVAFISDRVTDVIIFIEK